jgi:hypothetical protein
MNHAHTWRVTGYVLLDLPDVEGYADRFLAWRCPCGEYCWLTGHIRLGEPLRTPAFWNRVVAHPDDYQYELVVTRQGRGRGGRRG